MIVIETNKKFEEIQKVCQESKHGENSLGIE